MIVVRSAFAILAAMVAAAAAGGCTRTFSSTVVQPNPLEQPLETLRESEESVIVIGDMDLEAPREGNGSGGSVMVRDRYPLVNVARFTVVSRDRLRFHVQLEHKWQEWTDLSTWKAYLVDDRGRRYDPAEVDPRRGRHIVKMWDYEQRSTVRNDYGDITHVNNDGWKRRQPLGSLSLFRGRGDFVFYHRDIFRADVKSLKLHIERDGTVFEFNWRFADESAPVALHRRK